MTAAGAAAAAGLTQHDFYSAIAAVDKRQTDDAEGKEGLIEHQGRAYPRQKKENKIVKPCATTKTFPINRILLWLFPY